jgi:hypothetical protein
LTREGVIRDPYHPSTIVPPKEEIMMIDSAHLTKLTAKSGLLCLVVLVAAAAPRFAGAYTLEQILGGIAAHEGQIHSAEFDLTCQLFPSDQHPKIPPHFKMHEGHYVWDSNFNITIKEKVQVLDRSKLDASGKSIVLPAWTEDKSWDHKQIVCVKKSKVEVKGGWKDSNEAFIDGADPRDIWSNFYVPLTPMGALGYMAVDLDKGELPLSKTLAKYGATLANPPTEIVGEKETYVVETSFANNSDNPLQAERNLRIRYYICPTLQFSPLKIEYLKGTAPYRRHTIEYTTIDGIVFPAVNRESAWFPSGPKKGLEIAAPREVRYMNVCLNKASPKPVEIPNGFIVHDDIIGVSYEKGSEKTIPRVKGMGNVR